MSVAEAGDVVATPSTATTATREAGVVPVKAEYLVSAPPTVSLDAAQRTRGMNKGEERQRSEKVEGTSRPTLEGEVNFFAGTALSAVKGALKAAKAQSNRHGGGGKRSRSGAPEAAAGAVPPDGQQAPPAVDGDSALTSGTPSPPSQGEASWRELVAAQEAHRTLLQNKTILAPLTTVGNLPFRRICKEFGADVTLSEMAVVYNLNRTQKSEWSLLRRHTSEDIFGIQLAVSNPQEAAQFASALEASGFSYDFLDINGGCPIDAMNRNGCGCALLERRGYGRIQGVVRGLLEHQSKPVTLKCRIGADEQYPSLHKDVAHYEAMGLSALTIHGRSRKQRYTKLANWDYVEQCAGLTSLPVIGNGDILGYEDVLEHRAACPHLSSVMIGRGALIKPWIFREVQSGQTIDMSSSDRMDVLRRFCSYGLSHWGADTRGVMTTRRFLCEWLSFFHRYVPAGLLETLPQRMNERPPSYRGRDEVETMLASPSVADWISLSELLLGPVEKEFHFTPKHKSNSYRVAGSPALQGGAEEEEMIGEG